MLKIRYLILTILGGVTILFLYKECQTKKKVHFSFDDVAFVVKDNKVQLDDSFINSLKWYHSLYGAKFSLYCFDVPDIDSLSVVENNKDKLNWLKFSYHGSTLPFDSTQSSIHYIESLKKQISAIKKIGYGDSCLSNTVRLHYFYADSLMLEEASQNGITTFLSADTPGRISYSLNGDLSDSLYNTGVININNRKFYRTDIRIENTKLTECISNRHMSDSTLVIFTHQNEFGRYSQIKTHILMLFLWLNNYEFVTDL